MDHKVYKNLKLIRELKNLTREYVAYELNMSSSGYGKIERGEVDLTLTKLIKIADVFAVSVEFIFNFNVDDLLKDK